MVKRIISFLLVLCTLVSILPMDAFANGFAPIGKKQSAAARNAPKVNWHNESQNSFASVTNGTTTAANMQQETQNTFKDVSNKDWFHDAVMYAKQNGIFGGTGNDTFSPDGTMTRAMYVTVLGRIAGVNVSKYSTEVFKDVKAGMWYAPFVAWAVEKGITTGTGDGSFSPDATITREQMATLTVRYFESYKVKYETSVNSSDTPKDLSNVSPWAVDAVLKLWHAGLFRGDSNGNFNPGFNATRAEAATFCMRTNELVKTETIKNQPTPTPLVNPTPVPSLVSTSSPAPASTVQSGNSGGGGGGGGSSGGSPTTYTLTFNTNGGSQIDSLTLNEGTALSSLPTPYKLNAIFLGWYKDSGFSKLISGSDTLTCNMTLYAKYADSPSVNETQSIPSISKLDQAKSFTIAVSDSTGTMTAEQVKAAMTFESPSNPDFAGIAVTGSGGHFTVAAQGGAFEEGATYKLTLNDKNLSFTGEDKSTTIYNFSIARQKVMNLGLKKGMVYISASDVWDMTKNGDDVSSLSVPLAMVSNSDTDLSKVDLQSGTFKYSGNDLKVGDTAAIYEGIRPDQRNLGTSDTDAGTVAYVNVTAINGDTYTYGKADSNEVLFTPDILPVSNTADTDGDPNNHSITVNQSVLNYSDSKYSQLGLDAKTTVNTGDFISFFTGTFGDSSSTIAGFGKITGVNISGGNYIITYTDTTQDQVKAAMDIYNQKTVDGKKLIENTDVPELEAKIEQQAVKSGFVDEASKYLAALAMDTDSFKQINSDFDLRSYNITLSDGAPVSDEQVMLMGGSKVKVENKTIHARLSTQLEHFAGLSGVRCALEVGCDIVIDAGESNKIVIHLSGTFEQEVRIKVSISGGAVWKWAFIFPYIDDYRLNGNIDAYTYTGIRINATIGTFEKDAEWDWDDKSKVQDIGKQIKELMDKKDQYIGDGINTVAGTLADKYSKMLENDSDWIDLFDKELYSMESFVDPLHILVYGIKVSFVVSAKMNISLGCDFYYENAKRYIFTIGVFSKTKSTNTINLVEERYQFTFYVMGTLGLRAGIRLEVAAGLLTLKLDSIGFVAEVGAYVQLWGYFYYELTYTASGGKTSKYSGAMYLEFGIYLEISFKAQLFNGTFEYKPTLYENQWPLLSVGSQQNVYDFSFSTADTPKVSMAKQVTSFVLPDSTFSMSYMDMKTGKTDKKTYDDSKDFTIQMTNSDFKYNPANNTVTVTPGSKVTDDGQMVVTWNGAPVAFTSTPISRTISLHWENLKSAYSISFNSNGGSAVGAISLPYNTAITAPANPQKMGYVFGGWYKDQNCTQAYTIPATMQAEDVELYAKWTPSTTTKYTVEHYQQNLTNDLYTLADTDSLTGTTDTNVSPLRKTYDGFTAPEAQSITIKADGSSVLRYYYTRRSFTLTFNANDGTQEDNTAQVKYGASIAAPIVTKTGYTFVTWSSSVAATMPAQNTTYTAQWKVSTDTPYKVEHYQQNINDNNYSLAEIEELKGTTNTTATATAKSYTGFTYDSSVSSTVAADSIAADGSLTLKLYYTRKSFTLTFDANGGTGGSTTQVKYGAAIAAPTVTKSGYTFANWSPDVAATMPAQDTTYTAQWTAGTGTAYKVEHYQQNINDDNFTLAETEHLQGATNVTATAIANSYTGFTYDSSVSGTVASGSIAADGSLTLKLYYIRKSFTLTFDANGGTGGSTTQVKYGAAIAAPTVTKTGYTFANWLPDVAATMPAEETTYTAQWTESGNTSYNVEHYQQNINDNNFTLAETENLQGATNATATASAKSYTGFTYDNSVSGTVLSGTIVADGSLTLKLYYTRNSYTLTFDANGGTGGSTSQVKYGAAIVAPTVTRSGYTFANWSSGVASVMPAQDTTYIAQWTAGTSVGITQANYSTVFSNMQTVAGASGNYILMENISVGNWTPIGSAATPFTGVFDGNGHTITGLTINISNGQNAGMFDTIGISGIVKNLKLSGGSITGDGRVGGIAAQNNGTIQDCINGNSIQCNASSALNSGGIAGDVGSGAQVLRCHNSGTITSTYTGGSTGGIVGDTAGLVQNCYNTGAITSKRHAGGISGYIESTGIVDKCYSTGDVYVNDATNGMSAGGVVGKHPGGTFSNSAAFMGTIKGDMAVGYIGRIAGNNTTGTNCYADKNMLIGNPSTLSTVTSTDANSSNGNDITTITNQLFTTTLGWSSNDWVFGADGTLPKLPIDNMNP